MAFFAALCHVVGPQNNFGDICCCLENKNQKENDGFELEDIKNTETNGPLDGTRPSVARPSNI